MKLLLDTHVFLWFILDDPRIVTTARPLLVDPDLSGSSAWLPLGRWPSSMAWESSS